MKLKPRDDGAQQVAVAGAVSTDEPRETPKSPLYEVEVFSIAPVPEGIAEATESGPEGEPAPADVEVTAAARDVAEPAEPTEILPCAAEPPVALAPTLPVAPAVAATGPLEAEIEITPSTTAAPPAPEAPPADRPPIAVAADRAPDPGTYAPERVKPTGMSGVSVPAPSIRAFHPGFGAMRPAPASAAHASAGSSPPPARPDPATSSAVRLPRGSLPPKIAPMIAPIDRRASVSERRPVPEAGMMTAFERPTKVQDFDERLRKLEGEVTALSTFRVVVLPEKKGKPWWRWARRERSPAIGERPPSRVVRVPSIAPPSVEEAEVRIVSREARATGLSELKLRPPRRAGRNASVLMQTSERPEPGESPAETTKVTIVTRPASGAASVEPPSRRFLKALLGDA